MISDKATIETKLIGQNVNIEEYCVIRSNVKIGNNVIIHSHVTINEGVRIDDNVEIFSGTVIGKAPKVSAILSRELDFSETVHVGKNSSIGIQSIIYYDVEIGSDCLIGDGVSIREKCKIGDRCIIGTKVTLNYNVVIGNESVIMAKTHITGNSKIGKKVFISVGVVSANDNDFGVKGYDENVVLGPVIRDYAKIGEGAVLLPRIEIGENALVAAGSIVTRSVKNNSVVMGNPARHVRFLDSVH